LTSPKVETLGGSRTGAKAAEPSDDRAQAVASASIESPRLESRVFNQALVAMQSNPSDAQRPQLRHGYSRMSGVAAISRVGGAIDSLAGLGRKR